MTAARPLARWGRRLLAALAIAAMLAGGAPAVAQAPTTSTTYPGGRWEPGPARYGAVIEDDVPIPMPDGAVLRASVAWPTDLATGRRAEGRFPVIVEHTPYVQLAEVLRPLTFFTERGYIYVLAHARGTGPSGGAPVRGREEGQDGRAIVDWAVNQLEGSDGRIALVGCSAPAAKALFDAAAMGPDSPVKALVAACNGFNSGNRGTMMRAGMLTSNASTMAERLRRYVGSEAASDGSSNLIDEIRAGGTRAYEGEYWRDQLDMDLARPIVESGIPILLWSGWQDRVEGAVRTYTALQNAWAGRPVGAPMAPDQPVTPRYQLIMTDHGHARGLDLGIYLQWIETWLNGVDTGIARTPTPMHLYEVATGRWVNLARFPAVERSTPWYLAPGGGLTEARPPDDGTARLARVDPAEPDGRLSFVSPVLPDGLTLSGPLSARVYASSSNTNLVLIARLFDVAADGSEVEIAMGAVLGSQHELDTARSWTDAEGTMIWPWPKLDSDEYLVPGRVYSFDIALLARQWGVAPGHRLRFELIAQSTAEQCAAHPTNSPLRSRGMVPCELTVPQEQTVPGGVYTIHLGGEHPSAVNLPQLAFEAQGAVPAATLPFGYSESNHRLIEEGVLLPLDWGQ